MCISVWLCPRACTIESWKGVYLCVAVSKGLYYRELERCVSLCGCVQAPVQWRAEKVCISVWLCPRACTIESWKGVYLYVAASKHLCNGELKRCVSLCGCVQGPVL